MKHFVFKSNFTAVGVTRKLFFIPGLVGFFILKIGSIKTKQLKKKKSVKMHSDF